MVSAFKPPHFGIVCVLLLATACGKIEQRGSAQLTAPSHIKSSFLVEKNEGNPLLGQGPYAIGVKRSSLNKEFLLQAQLIMQPVVPQYNGLKSRLIVFQESGNQLYMLESTYGHTVTSDLPQHFVLAKFKILAERNNTLFFDFAEGMSKIFVSTEWRAQDVEGSKYKPDSWHSMDLDISFIEKAQLSEDLNSLVLTQIAQLKATSEEGNQQVPIEVKYYITPYATNEGFQSVISKDHDRMGFFEIAPQLQEHGGEDRVYASKWDERKAIVYAISDNTPAEYREAIKDGVLYWNKAFGKELVQVIQAPKGVTAPDYNYNVIQWVEWNDAGFAYADAQMDPKTGEVYHAQIFLTSVFAFGGINKARKLLRKLDPLGGTGAPSAKASELSQNLISLAGFQRKSLCEYTPPKDQLVQALGKILASEGTEAELNAKILKVANDYLREVTAHEVGHTLGLRHNFAGSLASNFPLENREALYASYLKNGKAPEGLIVSSSVMDYQKFEESTLTGDQVQHNTAALDYDIKAIQALYFKKTYQNSELPLFCTDSHVGLYEDCNRFDAGGSLFENVLQEEKDTLTSLPYLLMERYITAKSPLPGYPEKPLKSASLSPLEYSKTLLTPRASFLSAVNADSQYLKVRRSFDLVNDLNEADVATAEAEYVAAEVKRLGGVSTFFKTYKIKDFKLLQDKFSKLIDNPAYSSGVGPGGQPFSFSNEDKELMKSEGKKFFKGLTFYAIYVELALLQKATNILEGSVSDEFESLMLQKSAFVLLSSTGTASYEKGKGGEGSGVKKLEIPEFIFPTSMRISAVALLFNKGEDQMWGVKIRYKMFKILKEKLNTALQEDIEKAAIEDLPDELARWVIENRKVLNTFRSFETKDTDNSKKKSKLEDG